jgi:hypothetical protein
MNASLSSSSFDSTSIAVKPINAREVLVDLFILIWINDHSPCSFDSVGIHSSIETKELLSHQEDVLHFCLTFFLRYSFAPTTTTIDLFCFLLFGGLFFVYCRKRKGAAVQLLVFNLN